MDLDSECEAVVVRGVQPLSHRMQRVAEALLLNLHGPPNYWRGYGLYQGR